MKIQFKIQTYQTAAVEAVLDCFAGQPYQDAFSYQIDSGLGEQPLQYKLNSDDKQSNYGFRNQNIVLTEKELLTNIQTVQKKQNLFQSPSLKSFTKQDGKLTPPSYKPGADLNLDIEMETGTGKTYCYIKTIFEMNKRFGWTKFIIMVPSLAIREGVQKSLEMTADHFASEYNKKARFFTYNSKRLHEIESFSSDAGINVMVINIQAFNASGADNRRIYDILDNFQSRKPIDVIRANRPILILDEPQKMEGKATLEALPKFDPLFILRYSATHSISHNLVYRLDAVDAYNQKLVKKISVRGIQSKGIAGTSAYLYLQEVELTKQAPIARLDMQVQLKSGQIKNQLRRIERGDNLYDLSNQLEAYRDRFVVVNIDARDDSIEFENGIILRAGEVQGDITEEQLRRIQIRETINAHLDKERSLYTLGIKTLSLFFIDEVVKYRDYSQVDEKGDYARVFEEEYQNAVDTFLAEEDLSSNDPYRQYLLRDEASRVHQGYFSIDKNKKMIDPRAIKKATNLSDDVSAYDLIMKEKEQLLSIEEPTRFIFSHSALREGWDNPNVFVLCMLKQADPEKVTTRRQEVGRGLRISVNKDGERMDDPNTVHDINVLTVVANESFTDFATSLQKDMLAELASRPRKANEDYFKGKLIKVAGGQHEISEDEAKKIHRYLIKNDYVDDDDNLTDTYHQAVASGNLAPLPAELKPLADGVQTLIASVFTNESMPTIEDGRKPKKNYLNGANLHKKEFQELWSRINQKAIYKVGFDSNELVRNATKALNNELHVTALSYTIETGSQKTSFTAEDLRRNDSFKVTDIQQQYEHKAIISTVKYDLLGKISENTELTRETVAQILSQVRPDTFAKFKINPEHFISEASRLINEQKATTLINHISYDLLEERHSLAEVFTLEQAGQDFNDATEKLKKHVYNYVVTDSQVEREFAEKLDVSHEIAVYAKLPNGFFIPTPVGNYNPDWAIAFHDGKVKHIYFVAETKGDLSSLDLRTIEKSKLECAQKFFERLSAEQGDRAIKYGFIKTYEQLMAMVA